jgi:hypothetical protein
MMRRTWRAGLVGAGALALLAALPQEGSTQALRGSARTAARYLEMRPITRDSVSLSRVTTDAEGRRTFEGLPVFCVDAQCFYYRSLAVAGGGTLTQDVSATAWGFGVQGLSAAMLVRGRARLGGEFNLPRADDPVDVILAYAELDRPRFRLRLGRQETLSTLGTPGFDGIDLLVTPGGRFRLGAFGGRSLGRALYESRSSALRGFDDEVYLLDDEAYLLGAEVGYEAPRATGAVLRYQREIFANRAALLSERVGLSFRTAAMRPVALRGAAEYDVALDQVGKAHATVALPLAGRRVALEATARRYAPLFELWTIWGFFSPVGFHEAELRAAWTASPRAGAWVSGAYRAYGETEAFVFGDPLRDRAWRGGAGVHLGLADGLTLNGAYQVEGAVGAFHNGGSAALAWTPAEGWELSLRGMASQQLEEFRVGEGLLIGGGAGVGADLGRGISLSGGLDVMRHRYTNRPTAQDWNQRRGWMMLQIDFGREAGGRRMSP